MTGQGTCNQTDCCFLKGKVLLFSVTHSPPYIQERNLKHAFLHYRNGIFYSISMLPQLNLGKQNDLRPVRDYYHRMLTEVCTAQQEGLTLDQASERLAVQRKFPAFREPPPGDWAHGMHERNIRNLWSILQEEQQPKTKDTGN